MANRDFGIDFKLRTDFAKANADLDRAAKELNELHLSGSKADKTLAQTIARYQQSSAAAAKLANDERELKNAVDAGRISQETFGRSMARIAAQRSTLSLNNDLRETANLGQRMGGALSVGLGSAAAAVVSFAGAAMTLGTAVSSFGDFIDYADKLNDVTIRLGASAEAVSGWAYAAKQTGTDIDALGVGFKKLQGNMAEALDPKSAQAGLFKALGVSVTDTSGKLKTLEAIVPEIATAFKGLNDDALQTKVAMDLFGKSGTNLIELLELGGVGLTKMQERARELGIVFSKETLTAADAFNDGLSDLRSVIDGIWTQIAADLLPVLNDFIEATVKWATEGGGAANAADILKASLEAVADIASGMGAIFDAVTGAVSGTGTTAHAVASDIRQLGSDLKDFAQTAADAFTMLNPFSKESQWGPAKDRLRGRKGGNVFPALGSVPGGWSFAKANGGTAAPWSFMGANGGVTGSAAGATQSAVLSHYRGTNGSGGRSKGKAGGRRAASNRLSDNDRLIQQADRKLEQMREQLALNALLKDVESKLSEEQRVRYETEKGQFKSLSAAKKEELIAAAKAIDLQRVATEEAKRQHDANEKAKDSLQKLKESLRTPAEVALEKAIEEIETLNRALAAGEKLSDAQRASLEKRSVQAISGDQPDFQGLAPEVGGAFGELQKVQQAQAAEEKWYQDSLARLQQYQQAKGANIAAGQAEIERLTALHQQRMGQIEGAKQQAMLTMAGNFFGQLATLQSSRNKTAQRIGKAAAIAQTVIATYQSATQAYAAMSGIPYIGPALGIAAAAAAVAAGLANVQQIRSQPEGYATGGYTGDGGKFEPAGIVHRGEFVVRKEVTRDNRVRNMLESINRNGPSALYGWTGYAAGGLVQPAAQPMARLDGVTPSLNIPAPKVNQQTVVVFDEDAVSRTVAANPHMETRILRVIAENPRAFGAY